MTRAQRKHVLRLHGEGLSPATIISVIRQRYVGAKPERIVAVIREARKGAA